MIDGINQLPAPTYFYQKDIIGYSDYYSIWGWFPIYLPWFQASGEQGSVVMKFTQISLPILDTLQKINFFAG